MCSSVGSNNLSATHCNKSVSCYASSNFTRIKCKFFKRLRNRGYGKFFLSILFGKIKFGCRNKLLKISEDIIDEFEIESQRSDSVLIEDAERMFQHVFSEVILPMENNPQNIHTVCIDSLPPVVTVPKVCLCSLSTLFEKNIWKTKKL